MALDMALDIVWDIVSDMGLAIRSIVRVIKLFICVSATESREDALAHNKALLDQVAHPIAMYMSLQDT